MTPARSKNSNTWIATFRPFARRSRNSAAVSCLPYRRIDAAMSSISAIVSLRKN